MPVAHLKCVSCFGCCYCLCWICSAWRSPWSKRTWCRLEAPCWAFEPGRGIGFGGGGLCWSHPSPRAVSFPFCPPSTQECLLHTHHSYLISVCAWCSNCRVDGVVQAFLPALVTPWVAQTRYMAHLLYLAPALWSQHHH